MRELRVLVACCLLMCVTPVAAKYFQFSAIHSSSTALLPAEIAPVWINYAAAVPNVPQYSKIEMGFNLPVVLETAVDLFLKTGKGFNPFDPEIINVEVVFTNGNLRYTSYGFYYEDFVRDASTIVPVFENCPTAKWISTSTSYKWHARFAPPVEGEWSAVVNVYLGDVSAVAYSSAPIRFQCRKQASSNGFLEIAADKHHFRLSGSKESFFCLGQNIAWPDGERFRGGASTMYSYFFSGGYMDVQDWIQDLAQNGGNMIRVVNVPWSYELEWDTVGVYNMAHAWELDSLFEVCERIDVQMLFCMQHGTYNLPAWDEEHLTWKKHPYHKYLSGVAMPEDFLTDSIARKHFRNKLHYFLARWGYSKSLGIFQLLSEMEQWTLRGPKANLKYNKSAQRKFLSWHNEMLSFAKSQVLYRPLLTSTSYGAPPRDYAINAFSSPFVDVVCPKHCYFTQRNDNVDRYNEINNAGLFEKGIHGMFPNKPAVIDETGFGTYVADPSDMDACNDITYHNTLWATSFMGTAGTGFYWWRWGSNEYRKQNFPALAAFFADVDFTNFNFVVPGHWEDATRAANVSIETFYTLTDDRRRSRCIGWVHNASYWWGNISQACKDRNGKSTVFYSNTRDDVKITAPRELPAGTTFEVHDLAPRASYNIMWYSTREAGKSWSGGVVKTNGFGVATLEWVSGAADYGYRLERVL